MVFRVGCIGAGYFAAFHYEAWSRVEGACAVAAVDQDASRAAATGLPVFKDAHAMLAEVRPDIVDIITPPPTHLEMIEAALNYGPRAIICQKPFCVDLEQAKTAAALAAEAGVPLVVHENFRFQPWYRTIKTAIDAGQIGALLQMTFRLRPGDGQGTDAYLDRQPYFQTMPRFLVHETAVHWIDTFRFIAGRPKRVFADLRRLNPAIAGEDAGVILFDQGDGVRAIFDGNRLADHKAENTRCTMGEALVEGTEGTLSLHGDGSVRLRPFRAMEAIELLAPATTKGFGGDCVFHLQAHVLAALRDGSRLENTAEEYLDVIATEEAIYQSSETGRWIEPVF